MKFNSFVHIMLQGDNFYMKTKMVDKDNKTTVEVKITSSQFPKTIISTYHT